MDTRFLESFVSVIEHGSIAEAARRLNLTPAAVAQRIHALEGDIGARLLTRSGRTVRATEAGAAILDRARHLLQDTRDLQSIASDETAGELRLGAVSTAISGLLPDVLTAMIEKYPQIEIYILPGTSAELYHKVLSGDLDAALIAQPPFMIPKACDWRVFRDEPLVVLRRQASAFLIRTRRWPPSHSFATTATIGAGGLSTAICARREFARAIDLSLTGSRQSQCWSIGAGRVARAGLGTTLAGGLSLAKLPVPNQSFTRRMGLLWTRASLRVRLVQALLDAAAASPAISGGGAPKHPRPRAKPR